MLLLDPTMADSTGRALLAAIMATIQQSQGPLQPLRPTQLPIELQMSPLEYEEFVDRLSHTPDIYHMVVKYV